MSWDVVCGGSNQNWLCCWNKLHGGAGPCQAATADGEIYPPGVWLNTSTQRPGFCGRLPVPPYDSSEFARKKDVGDCRLDKPLHLLSHGLLGGPEAPQKHVVFLRSADVRRIADQTRTRIRPRPSCGQPDPTPAGGWGKRHRTGTCFYSSHAARCSSTGHSRTVAR